MTSSTAGQTCRGAAGRDHRAASTERLGHASARRRAAAGFRARGRSDRGRGASGGSRWRWAGAADRGGRAASRAGRTRRLHPRREGVPRSRHRGRSSRADPATGHGAAGRHGRRAGPGRPDERHVERRQAVRHLGRRHRERRHRARSYAPSCVGADTGGVSSLGNRRFGGRACRRRRERRRARSCRLDRRSVAATCSRSIREPELPVDLVVANLPYIASDEVPRLAVAASFEPASALDGGPDGLDVVRRLLDGLDAVLAPGGQALLEIGADQGVSALDAARRH